MEEAVCVGGASKGAGEAEKGGLRRGQEMEGETAAQEELRQGSWVRLVRIWQSSKGRWGGW